MHVINRLAPTGGAEVSLVQLLPALRERGIGNHVLALREHPDPSVAHGLAMEGFDVDIVGSGNIAILCRATHCRASSSDSQPDLVHATLFDATTVARLSRSRAGTPTVCSVVNSPWATIRAPRHMAHNGRPFRTARSTDGWRVTAQQPSTPSPSP